MYREAAAVAASRPSEEWRCHGGSLLAGGVVNEDFMPTNAEEHAFAVPRVSPMTESVGSPSYDRLRRRGSFFRLKVPDA